MYEHKKHETRADREGKNIGKLPEGHRAFVFTAIDVQLNSLDVEDSKMVDHLTSWLVLSIGLQSMNKEQREQLLKLLPFGLPVIRRPPPLYSTASVSERAEACRYVEEITIPYRDGELTGNDLATVLHDWESRAVKNIMIRVQHGRLRARLITGDAIAKFQSKQ